MVMQTKYNQGELAPIILTVLLGLARACCNAAAMSFSSRKLTAVRAAAVAGIDDTDVQRSSTGGTMTRREMLRNGTEPRVDDSVQYSRRRKTGWPDQQSRRPFVSFEWRILPPNDSLLRYLTEAGPD